MSDDKGHPLGLIVRPALVLKILFSQLEPLIAGIDDNGVVVQAFGFEVVEQALEVVVDSLDAAQVLLEISLVGQPGRLDLRHFVRIIVGREFPYEYETERLAIDLLSGGTFLRDWVDDPSAELADFDERLKKDEQEWSHIRAPYLLY